MDKNREKIIKELKKNINGFTISELAKKLNLSRQTIANCFAFLEGAQNVTIRQVGMAKIYFWEEAHFVRTPKNSKNKFLQEAKK